MINNNIMVSRGEIPDSSFLFRNFSMIKWLQEVSDDDLIFINDCLYTTLHYIDILDIDDYRKARLVFSYMNDNPAFAWAININKKECLKYPFMLSVINHIHDYLINLNNIDNGREISLYVTSGSYDTILCGYIDYDSFDDKDVIQKIADILFVYGHIAKLDSLNVIASVDDKDTIIYDMLDRIMDNIDSNIHNMGVVDLIDTYLYSINIDPSEAIYADEFEREAEAIRDEIMVYIQNVLRYAMYRDSVIIKESYDNITDLISRFKGQETNILPILSSVLIEIYREVTLTLSTFYQEQILYNYEDAQEFTKFIKFLYQDTLINY